MGKKSPCRDLVGKLEGNSPLGRPGHRVKLILKKWDEECGLDSSGSR
jgi:hypothetical protein